MLVFILWCGRARNEPEREIIHSACEKFDRTMNNTFYIRDVTINFNGNVTLNMAAKRGWQERQDSEGFDGDAWMSAPKRRRDAHDEDQPATSTRRTATDSSPGIPTRYALRTTSGFFQERFKELVDGIELPKVAVKLLKARAEKIADKIDDELLAYSGTASDMVGNFLKVVCEDLFAYISQCKTLSRLGETARNVLTDAVKKAADFAAQMISYIW